MKKENVVVKTVCHSQMFLSGIFHVLSSYVKKEKSLCNNNMYIEDPRLQTSGMTALLDNGGFTLIELLVVVLIIGILAAVAVPQYQKAVAKARLSQAWIGVRAIEDAQQAFFLSHGYYATDLTSLDVEMPDEVDDKGCKSANSSSTSVNCSVWPTDPLGIEVTLSNGKVSRRQCMVRKTDTIGNKVCQTYGPLDEDRSTGGFNYYDINL